MLAFALTEEPFLWHNIPCMACVLLQRLAHDHMLAFNILICEKKVIIRSPKVCCNQHLLITPAGEHIPSTTTNNNSEFLITGTRKLLYP